MPRKRNLIFRAAQQLIGQPQDDEPTEPNVEVSVEVNLPQQDEIEDTAAKPNTICKSKLFS
jgi:hypothetical protein